MLMLWLLLPKYLLFISIGEDDVGFELTAVNSRLSTIQPDQLDRPRKERKRAGTKVMLIQLGFKAAPG